MSELVSARQTKLCLYRTSYESPQVMPSISRALTYFDGGLAIIDGHASASAQEHNGLASAEDRSKSDLTLADGGEEESIL